MFTADKKILILAPHTDDGEMGCGGSIHKWVEQGCEVHYIAFSSCPESLPAGLPADTLIHEVKEATAILGIRPEHLQILDFTVRRFSENRQDILEHLVKVRKEIRPDIIFAPSLNDFHQDHHVIAEEALRAFKNQSLFSYEVVWNHIKFENRCFIEISERNLQQKIKSLQAYQSQEGRSYMSADFITSLARVRGTAIQKGWAEVFDVLRLVM